MTVSLCMYVCMYIRMYVCMYVCMYLFILFIYLSAIVILSYGRTARRINITTMPDECKFDLAIHTLKTQFKGPLLRGRLLKFLSEKSELTLNFPPVRN